MNDSNRLERRSARHGRAGACLVGPLAVAGVVGLAFPEEARADRPAILSLEGDLATPVSSEQRDLFGAGLSGAFSVEVPVQRWLLVGGRLRSGFLSSGPAPADPSLADPGVGTYTMLFGTARVRPLFFLEGARHADGLFVDVGGGGGLTGSDFRAGLELGVGYLFRVRDLDLGPSIRYLRVFQPNGQALGGGDASVLLLGATVSFRDRAHLHGEQGAEPRDEEPAAPADSDHDGVPDERDGCPTVPEDLDHFQDEDGCPDADDDGDGIPDTADRCPTVPEDADGFQDDDGCPEIDNDADGLADSMDRCPNEPETVNGNADEDGCPDRGLIVLVGDRIVLEERVLFDFERARVKHGARPHLDAIVRLWRQHPEWARIRIEGHADARGNEEYNLRLSADRARNVMNALIERGMPATILESQGFGSSQPRERGETETAHQRNRRVEFVIVARSAPDAAPGTEAPSAPPAPEPPTNANPGSGGSP
ncbi:MAG: OmpA family protein [Polyangiales bacterium]